MRHTPGPWKFSPVDPCTIAIVDDDGSSIFDMTAGLNTTGQSALADNSRLVCAAPAMLAALQSALSDAKPTSRREYWRDSADGKSSELVREETWPDWIAAARAAIRAVTGEV